MRLEFGAYVTVRLLAPRASEALLVTLGAFALVTALHGACLAFGQKSFGGCMPGSLWVKPRWSSLAYSA